jgi:hypothetical protein
MNTILQLAKWLWRAWPLIVVLSMAFIHLLVLHHYITNVSATNKIVSLVCQLLGGGLILHSIASNIEIVKGKTPRSIFFNYLLEFPLRKKSIAIEAQSISTGMASVGNPKLTVVRNPKYIEEKIEYLQEQINEVRKECEQESEELSSKIDGLSKKMSAKTQETMLALGDIESKMEKVSVGGVMEGLFGVLLMFYGAGAGYFT